MPITKYEGRTLTKQVIVLEETWLVNCVLRECVIFYSGGPFEFGTVTYENCQWKFVGSAMNTIQLLGLIGLLPKPQTPVQMTPPTGPVN
jgi:hypothetical protein